jgi:hypothetical protein
MAGHLTQPMRAVPADMTPDLAGYYANRPQLIRNVLGIQLGWWGHGVCFGVVGPVMILLMKQHGIHENTLGLLAACNSWAVAFLVMYFSWKSDRTVTRIGRRLPYLLISAPPIILSVVLFPLFEANWILITLWIVQAFFMDMKLSTYPLLNIDCVPRSNLGQINAINAMVMSLTSFLVLRYGLAWSDTHTTEVFMIGAAVLTIGTLGAVWIIKEPPISNPATTSFRPWSTMAIAWRDKRLIVLMLGVATIHCLVANVDQWRWLWAERDLGLTRTEQGAALSWAALVPLVIAYPIGWLIDHISGYFIVIFMWLAQLILFSVLIHASNAQGLELVGLMLAFIWPLYGGIDLMVYRTAAAADIGSITSTNSFVRNMSMGFLSFTTGQAIVWRDAERPDYMLAFTIAAIASTGGIALIMLYRHLMHRSRQS